MLVVSIIFKDWNNRIGWKPKKGSLCQIIVNGELYEDPLYDIYYHDYEEKHHNLVFFLEMNFNIVLWVWEVIVNTSNAYHGAWKTIIIVVIVGSFPNISIEGLISSSALYLCRCFLLLLGSPLLVWQCLEFPSGGMALVGEPCNDTTLPCERGKI